MALMLRKACQPILDNFDMNAFHADIHTDTKNLMLYTPCGKNFAMVHGVLFGKMCPTVAEIDFACELLTTWIQRNVKTIDTYTDGLEKLQRMGKPSLELVFGHSKITIRRTNKSERNELTGVYGQVYSAKSIEIEYDNSTFILNKNGALTNFIRPTGALIPWSNRVDLPSSIVNAAVKLMSTFLTHERLETSVSAILSELNSCTD